MAMPVLPNTTCDVYFAGNLPPAAPDVAGVRIYLDADFARRMEMGESLDASLHFTHTALLDRSIDARDTFTPTPSWQQTGDAAFYVPDQNGTRFRVTFIERKGRGTIFDHKKAYLDRGAVVWPSNEL
jgi:hypothetical protein